MSRVAELLARFVRWWIGELAGALPRPLRALAERRRPAIVLSLDGGEAAVIEAGARGQTAQWSEPLPLPEAAQLASRLAEKHEGDIELRLPYRGVYSRRLELPKVGTDELARILALDLERSTPFLSSHIYSAFVATPKPADGARLEIEQLVVKKGPVDTALSTIADAGGRVAWIGCWNRERSGPLPVDFLVRSQPAQPARWLVPALAAALLATAGFVLTSRYENAVQSVASQVAAERGAAGEVQRSMEKSRRLLEHEASLRRLVDSRVQPLAVIEQLSRVLPDSAFLTEVRIEGDIVEMNGVGKMAAGLPQILEKSGSFTDANLTAPLTIDSRDDRERFSLKARYRGH